jgi:hypothetical protein
MTDPVLITILSPILITVGGILTWFLKSRKESLLLIEERSREKRMNTYKEILDPFIVLITPTASKNEKEKATNTISSSNYKKAAFDLITFGSDETVRCYNSMMQYVFNAQNNDTVELLRLFTDLILNIRKDLYSKKTKLKRSEVLEFTLTDIEKYRKSIDK